MGVLAISQVLFGFGIEIASIGLILFARAVAGLAAANFSIAQAAIADITEPKDRAKSFGLIGAAYGIGFIFGPLLGGWIAGLSGNPAAPFWLAGALGVLNLLFITLFLPETNKNPRASHSFTFMKGIHNIRAAIRDVDARPVYMANFLYLSGFTFMTSFIGVLLVSKFGFDAAGVGTFFGVVGMWVVFTQLFILRIIVKSFNERQILRYSLLMVAAAISVEPFLPNATALFIAMPFMAVPVGLSMANMTALVSKSVSAEKQGAALGISGSLQALAQGIVPLVAGVASGFIGIQIPFILGGILVLSGWATLFAVARK